MEITSANRECQTQQRSNSNWVSRQATQHTGVPPPRNTRAALQPAQRDTVDVVNVKIFHKWHVAVPSFQECRSRKDDETYEVSS